MTTQSQQQAQPHTMAVESDRQPADPSLPFVGLERAESLGTLVPASQAQAAPDEALLARLQACAGHSRRQLALSVGQIVFDEFFAGDAAAYSNRAPNKERSLGDFAKKYASELRSLRLPLSTLRLYVAAWQSYVELPAELSQRLAVSHLAEMRRITDDSARARLIKHLAAAHESGSTAEVLGGMITSVAAAGKTRVADGKGGRPRVPPPLRAVTTLQRAWLTLSRQKDGVAKMSTAERSQLRSRLNNLERQIKELLDSVSEMS